MTADSGVYRLETEGERCPRPAASIRLGLLLFRDLQVIMSGVFVQLRACYLGRCERDPMENDPAGLEYQTANGGT